MRIAISSFLCASLALIATAADPPRPSPPLTIERLGAPSLELSQYRGKVVALAFIFTTCSHCQDLTRTLGPLSREYALRGVQVLECAFNDDAKPTMAQFLQNLQPAFPVGWTSRAAAMTYLQRSMLDTKPLYVPHMVFLDRRGIIRAEYPGESDFMKDPATNIRAELEKLLKAPAK
jgi:thiol-disulfide isomerase/thioredoxin